MDATGTKQSIKNRAKPLLALALLTLASGCSQPATSPGSPADASAVDERRGQEIAEKMLAAYRQARSYADHATYTQHSVRLGEGIERDQPFFDMALAFERPNRLRLSFEESVEDSAARKGFDIASNGLVMWATSGLFPGQVQESAAPKKLTAQNLLPDVLLRDLFVNRSLGDVFPQLAMLLNDDDKTPVFPEDEHPRLLDTQPLRGHDCYRVITTSSRGKRTFWIDSENYTLHRMEVPVEADLPAMDPNHQYSQLAIWIDFEDCSFNKPIDPQAFDKAIAASDRRVRRFVAPPPPAPPENLGKPVADFQFETADAKPVTAKELAGKTVLFDFWQIDCPPCKEQTPALEQVYKELKDLPTFALYAVNIECPRHSADALARTLENWGGTMPVLRDPKETAGEKLKIDSTPQLMLLDSQGRLQYIHSAAAIDAKNLATLIRRVIAGADLVAEARAEHAQLQKDYERELTAATINDSLLEIEVPQPQSSERKLPTKLTATQLWQKTAEEIAHPGYILPLSGGDNSKPSSDAPAYLVLDGGDAVVELKASGEKLASHEVYGNSETKNGFLRKASNGGRLAVSGVGWQKVTVFDTNWKSVLTFPKDRHPGVADVQFAPGTGAETPELIVGYWGGIGIQGVGFDGKRRWSQRALEQVLQIVPVPGPKAGGELWCTSNRGSLSIFDLQGKPLRELAVGLRSLMYSATTRSSSADNNNREGTVCCGLTVEEVGHYQAVGFSPDGEIRWRFPLPAGEYLHHISRIQPVTLTGNKSAWMIAAADGTIFWLDHDGHALDKFQYGQPLTGLTLTNQADAAILLVSTPENLTAWSLKDGTAKDAKGAKKE
jgi:thiol-disulfide isomerase/thioredoxin/outer membrane lipoprotein-sorting protein